MSNMKHVERRGAGVLTGALALTLSLVCTVTQASSMKEAHPRESTDMIAFSTSETLSVRQQSLVPIAALAASGDLTRLNAALNQALDLGLTVSDAKEVLIQLYAYAGFPRSLNALNELMKVVEERKRQGINDAPGSSPSRATPKGEELLVAGTANQTKLLGGQVAGPIFEFAPTIDEYLKTHLFGDIFERDNLDWQTREVATVSMLSVLPGAEPQLRAHMRISMNVGLSEGQLRQVSEVLTQRVDADSGGRAMEALLQALSAEK
jgi:4-carboxymuconolactone decarboxylase